MQCALKPLREGRPHLSARAEDHCVSAQPVGEGNVRLTRFGQKAIELIFRIDSDHENGTCILAREEKERFRVAFGIDLWLPVSECENVV